MGFFLLLQNPAPKCIDLAEARILTTAKARDLNRLMRDRVARANCSIPSHSGGFPYKGRTKPQKLFKVSPFTIHAMLISSLSLQFTYLVYFHLYCFLQK